jgi:hypothetical protein
VPNRKRTMDATAANRTNISHFPSLTNYGGTEGADRKTLRWWLRVTNWIGLTMANEQKPSGWSWNPATITLSLVIAGGLYAGGWYMGQKDKDYQHLLEKIQKAETDAAEAKKLQTYSAGVADTHEKKEPKK